jgi:hypothetical protein
LDIGGIRLLEIAPFDERLGHSLVARIADPPICAEGAKLGDEVIISFGGIFAILLGIFAIYSGHCKAPWLTKPSVIWLSA